jgi:inner membrane protein
VVQARGARGEIVDPRWPRAAWLVSAAAHNAPDLDFVYAWITPGKLGYLLHHRGHTHTLAFAPLMALLPLLLASAWARRRGVVWSRADHGWLALLAGLGPLGHLLLDLSNNYGIHPFWPLSNAWIAGDTVFIVEPLFLAATLPMAMLATSARAGRIAWGVTFALALLAPWVAPFVGWGPALACSVFGALVLGGSLRAAPGVRPLLALAASLAVLGTFALSGVLAEARMRAALPGEVLDVARAPVPTDPTCWTGVVLSRVGRVDERGMGAHRMDVVAVALWPGGDPARCARALPQEMTVQRGEIPMVGPSDDPQVQVWLTEHAADSTLAALGARCDGHAFLRFARMPFVVEQERTWVLGDLRYDREPGLGFAELEVPREPPEGDACPPFVPPWTPWRAHDLLAPVTGGLDSP